MLRGHPPRESAHTNCMTTHHGTPLEVDDRQRSPESIVWGPILLHVREIAHQRRTTGHNTIQEDAVVQLACHHKDQAVPHHGRGVAPKCFEWGSRPNDKHLTKPRQRQLRAKARDSASGTRSRICAAHPTCSCTPQLHGHLHGTSRRWRRASGDHSQLDTARSTAHHPGGMMTSCQ